MAAPAFGFQQSMAQTMPTILCCMCGTAIPSNPSNMCANCIRSQVDITEGIPKQLTIHHCKMCGRYLNPPNSWQKADLESKELLSFCLKRIRGLNKVKLIDAGFVWTEPHSRRLKVTLTVQKEVFTNTILQQQFIVEFITHMQQCDQCNKLQSPHTWVAVVQVRQRVEHKRTIYFLEQLILKHNAHEKTINIKEIADGLDFFFSHRSHALKFIDFLQGCVPIRYKQAEQLVSHDANNNNYNYKYSYAVEIAPVCREDLICLPTNVARTHGSINPLVLCSKISNMVHILDPVTLTTSEILAITFWKHPFRSISQNAQLVEFVVLDVNPLPHRTGKYQLAEAQLARSSDLGQNDVQFYTRSHLGHLLKPGDTVMGYHVASANFNEDDVRSLQGLKHSIPDVILVRKIYPKTQRRSRMWKLKHLPKDEEMKPGDQQRAQRDYNDFLHSLEQDPDMRSRINLYKDRKALRGAGAVAQKAVAMEDGRARPARGAVPAAPVHPHAHAPHVQHPQQRHAAAEDQDDEEDPDAVGLEELLEDLSLASDAEGDGQGPNEEYEDEAEDIEAD